MSRFEAKRAVLTLSGSGIANSISLYFRNTVDATRHGLGLPSRYQAARFCEGSPITPIGHSSAKPAALALAV